MFHSSERVLVAVMNNRRDFEIAREQGWYRVPTRHAPPSTTEATVLAFYFTRAFGGEKWAIHWYGPVRGHELVRRRDLFPDEPDHPHADETYYKLQLGPLLKLEHPIPSHRWRRITFIETSWDRFIAAEEVNDLYISGADGFYVTLKDGGFWPEREVELWEDGVAYTVDIALPCREGTVAICLEERPGPPSALRRADLDAVREAVKRLGGPLPLNR